MDPMKGKNLPGSMEIHPIYLDLPCKAAGVIVRCQGKILMVDRRVGTLGRACPAGHLDAGESAAECASRELFEETGLLLHPKADLKLRLNKNVFGNHCGRGEQNHEWSVFEANLGDEDFPRIELREPKKHCGIGWFLPSELTNVELEVVWRLFLKKLLIINK
ncbi:MAG: NUDIX domain-containing protein [Patescibacteria group bacterium]